MLKGLKAGNITVDFGMKNLKNRTIESNINILVHLILAFGASGRPQMK